MDETKNNQENPLGLSKGDLESLFESTFENEASESPKNKPHKGGYFDPNLKAHFVSDQKSPISSSEVETFKPMAEDKRSKSSLRLKYEAEVNHMIKNHGDLEEIRRTLGLSKRKIAQLLLVDPSAWTRWTSKDGHAPPHIYRALEWYLLLQEKHPEYRSSLWLNAVSSPQLSQKEIEAIKKEVVASAKVQLEEVEYEIKGESFKEKREFERKFLQASKERDSLALKLKKQQKLQIAAFLGLSTLIIAILLT